MENSGTYFGNQKYPKQEIAGLNPATSSGDLSGRETVVVTGGAGFIGSHLVEELTKRGCHVIILDDLSTGRLESLTDILLRSNSEFIQGSVTDYSLLNRLFQGVDYVFHLAAIARVNKSIEDPLTTDKVNVGGTLNVLMASRENGVKKVIYTSSSAIYGEVTTSPQREGTPPAPISPYAISKLASEYYCNIFHQIYGLATVSLRYFNVYGSRQDPYSQYANVIPAFIGRIARDLPPIIYGDGEQSRDFIFIDDVIEAFILATKKEASGVYNIGSGQSMSINKLANCILKLMQKDIKPTYEKARAGDPQHTLADITKARGLGFKPKYSLEEGLKKIIPFYS